MIVSVIASGIFRIVFLLFDFYRLQDPASHQACPEGEGSVGEKQSGKGCRQS